MDEIERNMEEIERTDPNMKTLASVTAFPEPPVLRRVCGITTRMDFNYFIALLQSERIGAVVDLRGQPNPGFDSPRSLHALMENFRIAYYFAGQRGERYGYRFAPLLTTSREIEGGFHDKQSKSLHGTPQPFAWTEYLEGVVGLYKERRILTQGGFLHGLVYGPHEAIAFLCDCAHHHDCHRRVLLGILAARIPGVEVKHLEPRVLVASEPPLARRPPTRHVVRPIPDAGIDADAYEQDGSVVSRQGIVLARHLRADGHLDVAVAAERDGADEVFVLRQAPDLPIHPRSFGLSEEAVRDLLKPGHRIRYGVERLFASGSLRLSKDQPLALTKDPMLSMEMRLLIRNLAKDTGSVRDAFPGLERDQNRAFVPFRDDVRPVAVVRCPKAIVQSETELMITDAGERPWVFLCENRDFRLRHYLRQGAVSAGNGYQNAYALFSLADPDASGRRAVVLSSLFLD